MINDISERSKGTQKKYETSYDEVGKVIHRKSCWKFKFDHTSKLYMHKPVSILENEMHKNPLEF